MSLTALREEITCELARRVRELNPRAIFDDSHPSRLRDARDNLAACIDHDLLREDLLGSGASAAYGRTVYEQLCDVDSSVALAANTFGPFRSAPGRLHIPGAAGFDVLRLGKRLRTGLGGAPANLDVLALGERAILGASCVLTASLSTKRANLAASHSGTVAALVAPEWSTLYDSLCQHPSRFRLLDAAALIRQYIGMRSALADEPQQKTLLYVFWEPTDWAGIPAFARHRRELLEFSLAVAGSDIAFVSMSCSELWDVMGEGADWAGRAAWLEYLRARYVFGMMTTAMSCSP